MSMDTTTFGQAPLAVTAPAAQRSVYLERLRRLQRLRAEHEGELNERGIRLLDRSLFATYCACRDIGAKDEALRILANIARTEAA
jgi:hypothetical protein